MGYSGTHRPRPDLCGAHTDEERALQGRKLSEALRRALMAEAPTLTVGSCLGSPGPLLSSLGRLGLLDPRTPLAAVLMGRGNVMD